MAYFDTTYKFLLDGVQVYPLVSNEFKIEWEKEQDTFYFRRTLSDDVKFVDVDYDNINDSTIDHKFEFKIQYNNAGTWEDFYTGFFYKTNCNFDDDYKKLTVSPVSDDGWDDIKRILDNEYDLIQLAPVSTPVEYTLRPVLQIIWIADLFGQEFGGDRIMNISGTANWEETLSEEPTGSELINTYGFLEYELPSETRYKFYLRYLTTLTTFDSVTTDDRPTNDISLVAPTFKKISRQVDTSKINRFLDLYQTDPTSLGIIDCPAIPAADGKYYSFYNPVASNTIAIPINQQLWFCGASVWYEYDETLNQFELTNSEELTIADNYKISDTISKLLAQETDILHEETTAYSEFFYDTSNPISNDKIYPIITPKSNVRNLFYTDPARKGLVRLKEILTMLSVVWEVYWHIEDDSGVLRLRLEHISWYENGGTYGEQEITLNMITTLDKRNNFPLAYYQNNFSYNKTKMPQRYEFKWMDDVSDVFEGVPIRVLTDEIESGLIETKDTGRFTSDVDMILHRENIALDGWALLAAEYNVGETKYFLPFESINIDNENIFAIQNGKAAFRYLHPVYHRYNKPTTRIEINEVETTALSIVRNKQQEVKFTYEDITIDPLKLITTYLGSGQVENMSLNLVSNKYEITINHDTE